MQGDVPKPLDTTSTNIVANTSRSNPLRSVQQQRGFGASALQSAKTRERRAASRPMPAQLAGDILTAAQGIRDRHKKLFTADRKLKDRAARLFRMPHRPGA